MQATYDITTVETVPRATAVVRAELAVPEIGAWFGPTLGRLAGWLATHEVAIVGPPFARYHRLEGTPDRFEVEAGFPVATAVAGEGDVEPSSLPGGSHAATVHVGPYERLGEAYEALGRWIERRHGEPAGDPWEIYETDPETQPDPATWRTQVIQPYRDRGTG